jgi:hypothetical protein
MVTLALAGDEVEERYLVPEVLWYICFVAPTLALQGRNQDRRGWRSLYTRLRIYCR